LLDETRAIDIFASEHEREFGHVRYGLLVTPRYGRFELNPEGGEFGIDFGTTGLAGYG